MSIWYHHLRQQNFVCFPCRTAGRGTQQRIEICPKCGMDMIPIGERLKVPPHRAVRKWRRLERIVSNPWWKKNHAPVIGLKKKAGRNENRVLVNGQWRLVRLAKGRGSDPWR